MSPTALWLVLAGLILVAELTTGTFYLLMISLGALVGALLAYFDHPLEVQIAGASAFAVFSCLLVQRLRKKSVADATQNTGQLDVGNTLMVLLWDANGFAQVQYRGTSWQAQSVDEQPQIGLHVIVDVHGNLLKLKARPSAQL